MTLARRRCELAYTSNMGEPSSIVDAIVNASGPIYDDQK